MNYDNMNYDILKELFNISVGKASSLLSEIIDKKILLNVPDVEILSIGDNKIAIDDCLPEGLGKIFMVSSIFFEDQLTGRANLIFSVKQMRTFINLCLNTDEIADSSEMNFSDIDFDVIKEIGNIVLNSVVGEVSNFLDINISYTVPLVKIYNRPDFINDMVCNDYIHILVLHINFIIDNTKIEGAILVRLSLKSLNEIIEKIKKIEAELYG